MLEKLLDPYSNPLKPSRILKSLIPFVGDYEAYYASDGYQLMESKGFAIFWSGVTRTLCSVTAALSVWNPYEKQDAKIFGIAYGTGYVALTLVNNIGSYFAYKSRQSDAQEE